MSGNAIFEFSTGKLGKRPSAVMVGQVTYLLALVAALWTMLQFDVLGWKMAVFGIYTATAATIVALYAALALRK